MSDIEEIVDRAIRDIDRLVCADGPYGWEARPDGTDIILRAIDEATPSIRAKALEDAAEVCHIHVMQQRAQQTHQENLGRWGTGVRAAQNRKYVAIAIRDELRRMANEAEREAKHE